MKASELDKANGNHKEDFVPEVGGECEVKLSIGSNGYAWFSGKVTAIGERYALVHSDHMERSVSLDNDWIRPIQTEAEKRYEEQIGNLFHLNYKCSVLSEDQSQNLAEEQYAAGCRMTRELTDDDVERILGEVSIDANPHDQTTMFAKAIAAYVTGSGEYE